MLVSLTACGSGSDTASKPSPSESDGTQRLAQAIAATEKLTSYRQRSTVTTRTKTGILAVTIVSDVERPDRIRTTTRVGATTVRAITVRGDTWVYDATSKRWVNKARGSASKPSDPFAALRGLKNARVVAQDATYVRIEGTAQSGVLLRAFPSAGEAPQTEATVSILVHAPDGVIARVRATSPDSLFALDALFSRFGERFAIRAPG